MDTLFRGGWREDSGVTVAIIQNACGEKSSGKSMNSRSVDTDL